MKSSSILIFLVCFLIMVLGITKLKAFENYKFLTQVDNIQMRYAAKLAINDYTLYVYGDSLLSVYAANNISHPRLITTFTTNEDLFSIQPVPPYNLIVVGPMEFSLKENKDLNTLGRIINVKTYAGSNSVRQGANLFIANADTGLEIVDLGNGNGGHVVSYFHDYQGLKSIDVNWPMVYALNKFGLAVIDVSRLEYPVAKGANYQLIDSRCIAVKDTFALIGTKNSVIVMSIKDPDKPFIVTQVPFAFAVQNIRIKDRDAFVCLGKGGLRVLDLSRPSRPNETYYIKATDRILDVAFSDEYIYVADGREGIRILLYH